MHRRGPWLRLRGGTAAGNLYDVLGVGADASAQEIRTAYKRAALQLHPDKNIDAPEEAAINFRRLQHAYEVLGDDASRARYDASSRSSYSAWVVDGGQESEDRPLDLSQFFGAHAYSGYHEGPGGFFSIYDEIFHRIASLEPELQTGGSAKRRGAAKEERGRPGWPSFGNITSDYLGVVEKFYDAWSEFASAREFRSECVYDLSEASNRWERRRMEGGLRYVVALG